MTTSLAPGQSDKGRAHFIQRCAQAARTLALPGGIAWMIALEFALCAWLVPEGPLGRMGKAALLVTSILLLATARAWRANRQPVETFGLLAGLGWVCLLVGRTPPVMQAGLTPLLMTAAVLGILAWTEWKFAPDVGQTGVVWAVMRAAQGTLWPGIGMAAALLVLVVAGEKGACPRTLTFAVGAMGGHALGLFVMPTGLQATRSNSTSIGSERRIQ